MDKNSKLEHISGNLNLFKHKTEGRVRFDEVDSFGVAHNIRYFYWIEWARINYLNDIGYKMKPDTFLNELPVMTVHSSADYYKPLRFFEDYAVLTRVSSIGTSSLRFENVVLNSKSEISLISSAVLVNVVKETAEPAPVPGKLKEMIRAYEGINFE
jgi:acyl-CoA thioester hydrolase